MSSQFTSLHRSQQSVDNNGFEYTIATLRTLKQFEREKWTKRGRLEPNALEATLRRFVALLATSLLLNRARKQRGRSTVRESRPPRVNERIVTSTVVKDSRVSGGNKLRREIVCLRWGGEDYHQRWFPFEGVGGRKFGAKGKWVMGGVRALLKSFVRKSGLINDLLIAVCRKLLAPVFYLIPESRLG